VNHADIAWAQCRLGQCRFKLDQPSEAQAWFDRALESMARGDLSGTVNAAELARMRAIRAEYLDEF
jgi:hypothetical protein